MAVAGGLCCEGNPVASVEIFVDCLDKEPLRVQDIPEGWRAYLGVAAVGGKLCIVGGENYEGDVLSSVSIL